MERMLRGIAGDVVLAGVSFALAFLIRFEGSIPPWEMTRLLAWLPAAVAVRISFFQFFGLYRRVPRYVSMNDLLNVGKAVSAGSVALVAVIAFAGGLPGFPRSVFVIDFALALLIIGASRVAGRALREFALWSSRAGKKVLIVGAGDAGYSILREIRSNPRFNYRVVGFVDDDPAKQRMRLQGVPVRGTRRDIRRIAEKCGADEIIIALPSAHRREIQGIMDECRKTRSVVRILPALSDLIGGKVTLKQVREVQIEDLLGREEVTIDEASIGEYLAHRRVLVTGAGGSIGAEICRQVMRFHPSSLILFGRGENSIFEIYNELFPRRGAVELVQVIGDIINRKKLEGLFEKQNPQIVFHAGADKHVPLLESNPDEAVLNNVIGTRNVIEVAQAIAAEKVVCVSTDKAADPACVMGCTKRLAEMLIQGSRSCGTAVTGVRFGNVLGSRGSAIPLFREQIRRGGPVTVTHPSMTRYFMTIPEAAQLVLQSGAIGACGEIFLLDMGKPIRILDLARQMITLSGLEPGKDIAIRYTGLRPGEKLAESLTGREETLEKTAHPKIFRLSRGSGALPLKEEDLEELRRLAIEMDSDGIIRKLREMVPNYRPPE
ncbi:MAG: polysaccharide biosynthesis protein [Endomicrobiales bacterium]